MLTLTLLACELPLITLGAAAAAYTAIHPDRAQQHEQELADIDAWLQQIRKTRQ